MQRSIKATPWWVLLLLVTSLAMQVAWKRVHVPTTPPIEDFPAPPGLALMRLASLGDPLPLAKLSMLYLQSFDAQPGNVAAYKKLDYERLETWLTSILALDPAGQYPLFVASKFYTLVPDRAKQVRMMEFVYREFFKDPARRWQSLAYQTLDVQYRLKDLPLAQKYAHAIYQHARGGDVPMWVTMLEPAILEDMGDLAQARAILQDALARGIVNTPEDVRAFQNHMKWIDSRLALPK
jgi:hypothetical protein